MSEPQYSRSDFERDYAQRSGYTVEQWARDYVALPCGCDYKDCKGWQSVSKQYAERAGLCKNCGDEPYIHPENDPEYEPYIIAERETTSRTIQE